MLSSHIVEAPAVRPLAIPAWPCGVRLLRLRFGFTLIELMIVVLIVSILAAFAYPSYREQLRKSRRADAQAVLMQASQYLERVFTESGCYWQADKLCNGETFGFTRSPLEGTQFYEIKLTADEDTFTLTAKPTGSETGAGDLTLDQIGQRTLNGVAGW